MSSIVLQKFTVLPLGVGDTTVTVSYTIVSDGSIVPYATLPVNVYMGDSADFVPTPTNLIFSGVTNRLKPNKRIGSAHRANLVKEIESPTSYHFAIEVSTASGITTARCAARYTDIHFSRFSALTTTPEAGTIFPVQLTLKAGGTEEVRSPQFRMKIANEGLEREIFNGRIGKFAIEREVTLVIRALMPGDIPPGDYTLTGSVDDNRRWKDINPGDNTIGVPITVAPPGRDGDEYSPVSGYGVVDARRAVELALTTPRATGRYRPLSGNSRVAEPPELTSKEIFDGFTEAEKEIPLDLLSILPDVPPVGDFRDLVMVPEVNAGGYTGQGIIVAVIDTGVNFNHPDLAPNIWRDKDGNPGFNFPDENFDVMDVHGHGTHVAGIIAAVKDEDKVTGVAPNVKIMPIKVLGAKNIGTSWDVARAIVYAADNGARVINLSLGGSFSMPSVEKAIIYAEQKGATVVMAAGNARGSLPIYPAAYATRYGVAVGAIGSTSYGMAGFSNKAGPDPAMCYILAPGTSIVSTVGKGFGSMSGTSMASPVVAGVIALILSANPGLTPAQVRDILIQTALHTSAI